MAFTLKQKFHAWWEGYELESEAGPLSELDGETASDASADAASAPDPNIMVADRLDFLQMLWGAGHMRPGSNEANLLDSKTLLLTDSTGVAEFGSGLGAYGRTVGGANICYVDCFESEQLLLDVSQTCKASAEERKFTSYNRLSADTLPSDRTYHRVLSNRFLHRREDPLATLGEMKAMLKESGYLLLNEYTAGPGGVLPDAVQDIMDGFGAPRALIGRDVYITALEELGFDVRINESRTQEHLTHIAAGWKQMDQLLVDQGSTFDFPAYGPFLRAEAERWSQMSKVLREGQLEFSRLFAILK